MMMMEKTTTFFPPFFLHIFYDADVEDNDGDEINDWFFVFLFEILKEKYDDDDDNIDYVWDDDSDVSTGLVLGCFI